MGHNSVNHLTRRGLLKASGGIVAGVGSAGILTACSGSGSTGDAGASRATTLRLGLVGAGKGETLNPTGTVNALINVAYCGAVFDSLTRIDSDLSAKPSLAQSWTMSPSGDSWTIQLVKGVTWHDGSPFTAADVAYTLKWAQEKGEGLASYVSAIDVAKLQGGDGLTLVIPMAKPNLNQMLDLAVVPVIKSGTTTFDKPVGTGPFVLTSFNPGQRGAFKKNPKYWREGGVQSQRLEIISLTDDTARLNALMSGQIDALVQMPLAQAKGVKSRGFQLIDSPSNAAHAFYMAVDQKPFDDVRVRQALRLIADRQELVDVALNGYGKVANDLYGVGLNYYDSSLPQRKQDIAAAKALLAQAGHGGGLSLTLQTSSVVPGMTEAATVFQRQAASAGVKISIVNVDPSAYFDPTQKYLKMAFAQTYWSGATKLAGFYKQALLKGGFGNETHWDDPRTTQLITTAVTSVDTSTVDKAFTEAQQQQYDEGGYLWWATADNVDASSSKVRGLVKSKYYPLGLPWSLAEAYVES